MVFLPPPEGLTEMLRTIQNAQARIHDVCVVPASMMRGVDEFLRPTAERIAEQIAEAGPRLWGLQVRFSNILDGMQFPVRRHRKRKWMSEAYHRRIQKKWNKRFGTGPAMVLLNSDVYRNPTSTRTTADG